MKQQLSSILDIGSSKLSVLTGTKGCNQNFVVYGKSDVEYNGFSDGEFFEPELLKERIGKAIENVELLTGLAIKELTVGIPTEFCFSLTKKINVTFPSRKKLKPEILQEIYESAFEQMEGYLPLSVEPIYNILDDGKKLIDVSNKKTSKLTAFINCIYARSDFIELFNYLLGELGIVKVDYVCSSLSETQFLLGQLTSEAMIIDLGYLTTSVAVAKGNGLVNLFSFSLGGAHIIADLCECLNLTFKEAEELKNNIVLSLQPNTTDIYETSHLGRNRKIFTKIANEIVEDRLNYIASTINVCIQKCQNKDYMPIYLTGGGISQIKGAKEILSEKLGQNIGLIYPQVIEFNKPYYSSLISLLNYSLTQNKKTRF